MTKTLNALLTCLLLLTSHAVIAEIDDTKLSAKIQKAFAKSDLYTNALVEVHSVNGFILLSGQVLNEEAKKQATNTVVFASSDIRRIINELQVVSAVDNSTAENDALLAQRIMQKLLDENEQSAAKAHVFVHRGVAYLMGAVTSSERDAIATTASKVSGVASIRTSFELVTE